MRIILAVAFALAAPAAAVAAPCAPTAQVAGEPELADAIAGALRARGIATGDDARCRELTAEVTTDADRVRVAITDTHGRRVERVVADADGAATTIEAWLRHDLTDPLLAAPAVPSSQLRAVERTATVTPRAPRVAIGAALDAGVSNDGALWGGLRAEACAMFGSACVGGRVRYAADAERSGDAALYGNARRMLDVALEVQRPVRRGRASVAPGIGVGLASVSASRIDVEGDHELEQASAVHALASVRGGYVLGRATALAIDVSVAYAPFARPLLGDLTTPTDLPLAASPKAIVWLGLGASFEGL